MDLRPYQAAAADFIYGRDASLVLAPVGAGKTAAALEALRDLIRDGVLHRVLIVAPLRVCQMVWPREALAWAPELTLAVGVGPASVRRQAIQSGAQLVVINFDVLVQVAESEDLSSFDGLLIDELTRLKKPGGRRFKALAKVPFAWKCGMTASFTSQGLRDIFGQVTMIDGGRTFGRSRDRFEQEYFYQLDDLGRKLELRPGALDQVMARVAPLAYVLEARIYTDTLPPLTPNVVRVALPEAAREAYSTLERHSVLDGVVCASEGVLVGKLAQLAAGFLYQPEGGARWYHTAKMDAVAELVESIAAPTLVVYWFEEELALLQSWYPDAPCLTGLTGARLTSVVDAFNAGSVPLLLLQPNSAAHGINLQFCCHNIVWASLPWSFELFEQAIGRVHRSGQTREVYSHVVIADETIDDDIWDALAGHRDFNGVARGVLKTLVDRTDTAA